MDHGIQFNNLKVDEFYQGYGVKLDFSSVYYTQANGMAEVTNKVIVNNLKKNLDDKKFFFWLEELLNVL